MNNTGRPTKYNKEVLNKIKEMVIIGYTNLEICDKLNIAEQTLYNWKNEYTELAEIMIWNNEKLDIQVIKALHKRAVGYNYNKTIMTMEGPETIKIHVPADTNACKYWLKARRKNNEINWNEVEQVKSINLNHNTKNVKDMEIGEWLDTLDDKIVESKTVEELEKMYNERE